MTQLPDRPDLDQLRRQAKDLQRHSPGGMTLASAQLAVAREHGFTSWPRLREAVVSRQRASAAAMTPDKHRAPALHPASEFIASARSRGWDPGTLPVGAVFTAQTFLTQHLDAQPDRYLNRPGFRGHSRPWKRGWSHGINRAIPVAAQVPA